MRDPGYYLQFQVNIHHVRDDAIKVLGAHLGGNMTSYLMWKDFTHIREGGHKVAIKKDLTLVAFSSGAPTPVIHFEDDGHWCLPNQLIGLELEWENCLHVPSREELIHWMYEQDGSLRAHKGKIGSPLEFKLKTPFAGRNLTLAIKEMRKHLLTMKVSTTDRTSLHVHVDMSHATIDKLRAILTQYAIFESVLFAYCGNPEKFYCAEWATKQQYFPLAHLASWRILWPALDQNFKYSGLNISPLRKKRSIEFRMHPGCDDMNKVEAWIRIIMRLIKNTDLIPDDTAKLSAMGLTLYAQKVFEEEFKYLDIPHLDELILKGVRLAQDMMFYTQLKAGHAEIAKQYRRE
jgi:hypothetical protein